MKWFQIALAAVIALALVPASVGQQEKQEKPSVWMKLKLNYSQSILSGLAKAEFDVMGENARSMKTLTQIERWVRRSEPGYQTQLMIFRFANEELIRLSDAKNLEGAALAFSQLTLSCVNCHKQIRERRKGLQAGEAK